MNNNINKLYKQVEQLAQEKERLENKLFEIEKQRESLMAEIVALESENN